MPYERTAYQTAANPKVNWGKFAIYGVVLPLIPISFIYDGKFDSVIVIFILMGFVVSIGFYRIGAILRRESASGFMDAKQQLSRQGFHADFEHSPQLLIDSNARKVAFVETANAAYDLYNLSDILTWQHQWVDKVSTKHYHGSRGVASSKVERVENVLVFKMNNPHKPLVKVYIPNYEYGELWMARLGALLKG